jgi:hypothetical protein
MAWPKELIYIMCIFVSSGCAILLGRAFLRDKARLLLWSALCFSFLAINNMLVFIDIVLLPEMDLSTARYMASIAGVGVLLFGFIWDAD